MDELDQYGGGYGSEFDWESAQRQGTGAGGILDRLHWDGREQAALEPQLQQQQEHRLSWDALRVGAPEAAAPRASNGTTAMVGSAMLSTDGQQDAEFALLQHHFDMTPRTTADMAAALHADRSQHAHQASDPLALERMRALQQDAAQQRLLEERQRQALARATAAGGVPASYSPGLGDLDLALLAQRMQRRPLQLHAQAAHGSPPSLDRLLHIATQQYGDESEPSRLTAQQLQQRAPQQQGLQWAPRQLQQAARSGLRPASARARTPSPVLAAAVDASGLASDTLLPSPSPAAQQLQQAAHVALRSASGRTPSPGPAARGATAMGPAASLRAAAADLALGPADLAGAQRLLQRAQQARGEAQQSLEHAQAQLAQRAQRARERVQHALHAPDAALQAWERAQPGQPEQAEGQARGKRRRTMPLNALSGVPAQAAADGGALPAATWGAADAAAGGGALPAAAQAAAKALPKGRKGAGKDADEDEGSDYCALHPNAIKLQLAIQAAKLRAGASGAAGSGAAPRRQAERPRSGPSDAQHSGSSKAASSAAAGNAGARRRPRPSTTQAAAPAQANAAATAAAAAAAAPAAAAGASALSEEHVPAAANGAPAAAVDVPAAADGVRAAADGARAAADGARAAAVDVPAARVVAAEEALEPAAAGGSAAVGRPRLYSLGDEELRRLRRELLQGVALWDRGIRVPAADRRLQMALAYLRFHTAQVEQLQRIRIVEVVRVLLGHPCPGVRGSADALLQVPSWAEVNHMLVEWQQQHPQGPGSSTLEAVGTPPGADSVAGPLASGGTVAVPVASA